MSYTKYSLEIHGISDKSKFFTVKKKLKNKDLIRYVFDEGNYFDNKNTAEFLCYDSQLWKNSGSDMTDVSNEFPEMTFRLSCFNENGEQWKEYYKAGKHETCYGTVVYSSPETIAWNE